jgi:signal transduction histidine kinase
MIIKKIYIIFLLSISINILSGNCQSSIDSLKTLLNTADIDSSTVSLLIKISKHYYRTEPDSTLKYAQKALMISNQLNYSLGKGKAYRMIGLAYSGKSELDKSLEQLLLALNEFKKAGSISDIGVILTSIGIVYRKKSEYDKALEYYLKSLEIIKIENKPKKISTALNNIGTIYRDLKDYDKALEYFNESLKINKEINNQEGLCYNYANMGVVYKFKKEYVAAEYNLSEALKLFSKFNFKNEMANVYSNLSEIYIILKKYDMAFKYIQIANKIYNETSNLGGKAETLIILSDIYINQKKYSSAETALKLAMSMTLETGYKEYELEAYLYLSNVDSAKGDYKQAFMYRNKYNQLKDSIFSIEKNKIISNIQEKYKVSEKEKENLILKNNIHVNSVKIRNQRIINYITGFSLALFAVVIVLIIYSLKKIRKSNMLLISKNDEIERQNQELEKYKTKLENIVLERTKELNEALINVQESDRLKTQFLQNLHHEIRTPINAISGFMEIQQKNNLKENRDFVYEINKSTEDLLRTMDRLITFSKFQIGDYELKTESVDLKNYFDHLLSVILEKKQFLKKDEIEIVFNPDYNSFPVIFKTDTFVFNSILDELLDNAFKFTEKGIIRITCVFEKGHLSVIVSDTGVGIKEELSEKIFEFMQKFDQNNTIYRGMGVGLAMVRKAVELLSGKIQITSGIKNGAELTVVIPELKPI